MKWYENAIFYHIYPLGLCGCPKENDGVTSQNHFDQLNQWTDHIKELGCNAIYIGPLFESVAHGYDTIDYKLVDRRLGTNQDFKEYVEHCHQLGIKVIVDGVFNHVGRRFFAFEDVKKNRQQSQYCDWFCNVNFSGNNEYNDGFCYENWGGYNVLVKLNQRNPKVKEYLFDVVRYWIEEFKIDGIRLDAADVLDHDFMQDLRKVTDSLKENFWLMGEVIHGNYAQWANNQTLHSVTNYELHKALFSGHNDHNYFEIAHSVQRMIDINGNNKLYTFVDNHDVARIATKVTNKAHLIPIYILEFGLPGIPSIYYGSEFAIEGRKDQNGPDDDIRPELHLSDYADAYKNNAVTQLIRKLCIIHKECAELTEGRYQQLQLTNRQFAFGRVLDDSAVIVALNNDDQPAESWIRMPIRANQAVDLLKADLEPVDDAKQAELEKEQKTAILEKCSSINQKIYQNLSDLTDMTKKLERLITSNASLDEIKEDSMAANQLWETTGQLYETLLNAQSLKPVHSQITASEDCDIRIEGDQLVVKLPANSGTMIRIYQE